MDSWKKLEDELPPDGVALEVADYAGRAEIARYELRSDRFKYGLDQLYYRRRPTLWRLYQAPVAPTKLEIDRPDFSPAPISDEPSFPLVARDPIAPLLVEAWAYLRMGQIGMALKAIDSALSAAQGMEPQRNDDPQILSAFRIAGEMVAWYRRKILGGK